MTRVIAFAALLSLGLAGAAGAQPACDGQYGVVRVSKLKPGKQALFAKAVADQNAWYRAKGITSNTQMYGAAEDSGEMVTLHLNAPLQRPTPDAGWEAFVAKFRDSSEVVSEKRVCLKTAG